MPFYNKKNTIKRPLFRDIELSGVYYENLETKLVEHHILDDVSQNKLIQRFDDVKKQLFDREPFIEVDDSPLQLHYQELLEYMFPKLRSDTYKHPLLWD